MFYYISISVIFYIFFYIFTIFFALCFSYIFVSIFYHNVPCQKFDLEIFHIEGFENVLCRKKHSIDRTNWLKRPKKLTPISVKNRIVVSREFDQAIQDIVDELLSYYIFSWYKPLMGNGEYSSKCLKHLNNVLRHDIWLLISSFIDRLYTVNYLPFVTTTLVKRILKHFQALHLSSTSDNISKDTLSLTDSYDLFSSSSSSSNTFQPINFHQTTNLLSEAVKNLNSKWTLNTSESSNLTDNFIKNSNAKYSLQPFVINKCEENSLIYKFIFYLFEILFKESTLNSKLCDNSTFLRSLLVDIFSFSFKHTIEAISDPSFINLQLLTFMRRYQFDKEFHFHHANYMELDAGGSSIKSHTVTLLQKYLHEHNFARLCEIIDQCDEIDSLRAIRLLIVGEILNAAVIEHLSRSRDRKIRQRNSRANIEFVNNSVSGSRTSKNILRMFNLNSSVSGSADLRTSSSFDVNKQKQNRVPSFKLNVPDSKAKILQSKDLRRFTNHLRFAKTVCEQKIAACKRQNAQQILTSTERRHSSNSNVSFFEESFTFSEISYNNSDLVRTFSSPNGTFDNSISNGKNVKKKIFQFRTIIINDTCREWLKRFVANSLFSQNDMRSSLNKFKIDSLLSRCCAYLIEVWENCEKIFEKCHNFYVCQQNNTSTIKFNQLINDVYLLTLNIVCDDKFSYTFSDHFLQLPQNILIQIERFLLGQLSIPIINPLSNYFEANNFLQLTNFDPEIIENTSEIIKNIKLSFEPLWMIFFELEKIIGHCLQEEIYPQFLISCEYDQMLTELDAQTRGKKSTFDFNPFSNAEKWNTQHNFLNRRVSTDSGSTKSSDTSRRRSEQSVQTSFFKIKKPVQKVKINSELVDLTKNRNILLNSLEFNLGTFVYFKALCEARLQFKIFVKHLLIRNFEQSLIGDECLTINKIANILKDDIVKHHLLYEQIHTVIIRLFSWLHSDFNCLTEQFKIVNYRPQNINNNQNNHLKTNKFLSNFVGNILGSLEQKGEYDLCFTLSVKASLRKEIIDCLENDAQSQLRNLMNHEWKTECSFGFIQKWLHNIFAPNLRMLTFLSRFDLLQYLSVFCDNIRIKQIDPKVKDLFTINTWKIITKQLHQRETVLQRHIKEQIKKLESRKFGKIVKNSKQNPDNGSISFKSLLSDDRNEDKNNNNNKDNNSNHSNKAVFADSFGDSVRFQTSSLSSSPSLSFSNISSTSSNTEGLPSNSLQTDKIEYNLDCDDFSRSSIEKLLKILTDNPFIVRMNAFSSLIKFDHNRSRLGSNCSNTSLPCFRCDLSNILLKNEWPDLNNGLLMSLFGLLTNDDFINPRFDLYDEQQQQQQQQSSIFSQLYSAATNDDCNNESIVTSISVSGLATGRLFAMQSNLPTLSNPNDGGNVELFLLHSRSLLYDRPAIEIIDYLLGGVRFFSNFCLNCTEKITQSRPIQASSVSNANKTNQSTSGQFRLFHQFSDSQVGVDIAASIKDSVDINGESCENLNNLELLDLGGDDAVDGDDEEYSIIEPLFQLLIEVFQLKGTVAKTFRRTLMLAFRLLFGSTRLSKHFKLSLQSVFTEKNILLWLGDILSMIKKWNIQYEESKNQKCQAMIDENNIEKEQTKLYKNNENIENILDKFHLNNNQNNHKNNDFHTNIHHSKKLQILTKQLLFSSVPSFASALFGQDNLNFGLNKCFDIIQYKELNKQLFYEFLEAFTLEYFADNMKK